MQNQSQKISDSELARMSELFAQFGGEIVEVVDNEKVVVAFDSLSRMMVVVDGFKARGKNHVVNSRKIDGRNVCTFSK